MDYTQVNLASVDAGLLDNSSSPALSAAALRALIDGDIYTQAVALTNTQAMRVRKEFASSRRLLEVRMYDGSRHG